MLCNNEGLCGYDYTNMQPRCFCYDKFEGDDCSIYVPNENVSSISKALPSPSPYNVIHTFSRNNSDGDIYNITYDLSPMALNGKAYEIKDMDGDRNYLYYIGIFQGINLTEAGLPAACNNATYMTQHGLPCTNISDDGSCIETYPDPQNLIGNTYAYQYLPESDWCCYLGTSYQWALYDGIDDAARGISIYFYISSLYI